MLKRFKIGSNGSKDELQDMIDEVDAEAKLLKLNQQKDIREKCIRFNMYFLSR